jgi:hypothetical protein
MPSYRISHDDLVFVLFQGRPEDALSVEKDGKEYVAIWTDACHAATKATELSGELLAVRFRTLLRMKGEDGFAVVGTDGKIYGPAKD